MPDQIDSNGNKENGNKNIYSASHDAARAIKVLNPLSPEHQVLRQSLLPGLINAAKYNHDRGEENVWLFEMGLTYLKHKTNEKSFCPALEELKVAGLLAGNRQLSTWRDASIGKDANASNKIDFYFGKGIVENLFNSLHIPVDQIKYLREKESISLLHPGKAAKIIYEGLDQQTTHLGWLGQLHPTYIKDIDLQPETFLFELDIDALENLRVKPSFQPVPTLPPVMRDLTVDLPTNIENAAIRQCISEAANYLKNIELVSIFL